MRIALALCAFGLAGLIAADPAVSACKQSDLTGRWVLRLDFPAGPTTRLDAMVCPIAIRSDGTMPPAVCDQLDETLNKGSISFSTGRFILRGNCTVALANPSTLDMPFFRGPSTFTPYSVTALRAWLSPDKQMFTGGFSFGGGLYATGVFAMRRN